MQLGRRKEVHQETAQISKLTQTRVNDQEISIPIEDQNKVREYVTSKMNVDALDKNITVDVLSEKLADYISDYANKNKIAISTPEETYLAREIAHDMLGFGPLEPLLRDSSVTDILVNRFDKILVERRGQPLQLSNIQFQSEKQVLQIAKRMASFTNRRLDESSPMVDTRLADGTRINIVIPPIAIDGTTISIRRFPTDELTLDMMVQFGSISEKMKSFFDIIARAAVNIIVCGGTGSGKTTLLNAISKHIDPQEHIVTIEDSAELRLPQTFVTRLETRPASLEGTNEVTQRDLVKNSLRMRPDRIVLGEVRGAETFDLLQMLNTGHEGMGTLHANSPRDALSRLETMTMMAGFEIPVSVLRRQISSSINFIIHAERMNDKVRRVVSVSEITGMEGDMITMQDIFTFETKEVRGNRIIGEHVLHPGKLRCEDELKKAGVLQEMQRLMTGGV